MEKLLLSAIMKMDAWAWAAAPIIRKPPTHDKTNKALLDNLMHKYDEQMLYLMKQQLQDSSIAVHS